MSSQERSPYLIQIGFDFGTSFSKCVYRDLSKDDVAWVFCFEGGKDRRSPFLIPSTVRYSSEEFIRHDDPSTLYPADGLTHIKFAIERYAAGDLNAPVLDEYKLKCGSSSPKEMGQLVVKCGVFLLATSINLIKAAVRKRFPDFSEDDGDQFFINMAIPVADTGVPRVESYFRGILKYAWLVAPSLEGLDQVPINKLTKLVNQAKDGVDLSTLDDICFVYPEVSANVQALIRSPAYSPSDQTIYFISDAGAGTVDQSVFTHPRNLGNKKLNYFAAEVLSHGSSRVEKIACPSSSTEELDVWRRMKEAGHDDSRLTEAKSEIRVALAQETKSKTINATIANLPSGNGVSPVETLKEHARVVFFGGGHTKDPYESGVMDAFSKIFFPDKHLPLITAIQTPPDLELTEAQAQWMPRLYVAYGLSFISFELAEGEFVLPPVPDPTSVSKRKQCVCGGRNRDCQKCMGRGWLD